MTTGEQSSGFTPEQAAMAKVTDIHKEAFLKHTFTRYGHWYLSGSKWDPRPEDILHEVDRLEGILANGLLAHQVAKDRNVLMSRNFSDEFNERAVSLFTVDTPIDRTVSQAGPAARTLRNMMRRGVDFPKIPASEVLILLINTRLGGRFARVPHQPKTERLQVGSVDRDQFRGITVLDQTEIPEYPFANDVFAFNELNPEHTAEDIAAVMRRNFGDQSSLYFPVYGLSGGLYWPQRMEYADVQNIVQERVGNG